MVFGQKSSEKLLLFAVNSGLLKQQNYAPTFHAVDADFHTINTKKTKLLKFCFQEWFFCLFRFAGILMLYWNLFDFLISLKKNNSTKEFWGFGKFGLNWGFWFLKNGKKISKRLVVCIWRPLLYQLSYTPVCWLNCFAASLFACESIIP